MELTDAGRAAVTEVQGFDRGSVSVGTGEALTIDPTRLLEMLLAAAS